ncbi:Hypothetical protein D9617_17g045880 [Elsinoe fawcettii]|nr:Hypothetical protein D9617_17g045880 [Elsinoe fawcettii]
MSTPTPGPHGQSAKHATPSHTGTTPRSVPSPALSRHHASSLSAKQPKQLAGGVSMAPSLSQASNTSGGGRTSAAAGLGINNIKIEGVSPHHHHLGQGLNFASPAGLMLEGMSMGTPGLGDPGSGLTGIGGVGMDISLSGMGINMQERGKRDEDEERRKKVKGLLERIGRRRSSQGAKSSGMGRVSDEGVRRVGRWAGFDVEVESKYDGKEWEGNRPIVIAGRNAVLLDLAFANHRPSKVEVTFNSEDEAVLSHAPGAAKVLKDDLTTHDRVALINTRLNNFANNLERLAKLDKLSSQRLNCVDAVTGLFVSLKRLYEHEKEAAKLLFGSTSKTLTAQTEREVMDKGSGRPGMHVGGRIGLCLDYWGHSSIEEQADVGSVHSLELTVEHVDPSTFPPIRISKDWLSERIIKPTEETTDPADLISDKPLLDWLEPAVTIVQPTKDVNDAMAVDGASKQPEVRFVARLHPPVVLPFNIATQILQSCGVTPAPVTEALKLYETDLLGLPATARSNLNEVIAISEHKIYVARPDTAREVAHRTSLYVPRADYGYSLKDIPFSHPRQIVAVLPILRQWAMVGSILQSAFPSPSSPLFSRTKVSADAKVNKAVPIGVGSGKKIALDALVAGVEGSTNDNSGGSMPIDVTLSTLSPTPTISLFFPVRDTLGSVTFSVGPDGRVAVTAQDLVKDTGEHGGAQPEQMNVDSQVTGAVEAQKKMARALEIMGDFGIWVEWIKQKFA